MDNKIILLTDYVQVKGLTKAYVPLLSELISIMNKDEKIIVNASLKRDIGKRINATVGSIDNMITRLVGTDILIRVDRGMYTFSSEVKGLSFNDDEIIAMTITYNNNKKNIKINRGEKNELI